MPRRCCLDRRTDRSTESGFLPLQGLFVTATDTGAGKTTLLCRLIPQLQQAGFSLRVRKPVESGCRVENGRLMPRDATALAGALGEAESVRQICAFRLPHETSPARAARLEGMELTVEKLAAACVAGSGGDFLLVEGAGGLYSPIAHDGLNADLARVLGLPLLIVVADRLGCINHALLTIEAAQRGSLEVIAVVVNETTPPGDADTDNYRELKALTDAPVFKTGYTGNHSADDLNILMRRLEQLGAG